uniref:Uncharacterized protein n=1 Tax=Pipistrellus kuhlii TaxID=59472 RepID=A0A7J7VBZ1_PIPKU|nr:hypothetical protein mPipKuh1_008539 [Pipistrellus kuhlii]
MYTSFSKRPPPHLSPHVPTHTVEKLWTINGHKAGNRTVGFCEELFLGTRWDLHLPLWSSKEWEGEENRQCPCQAHLTVMVSDERFKYRFKLKEQKGIFIDNHPDTSSILVYLLVVLKINYMYNKTNPMEN